MNKEMKSRTFMIPEAWLVKRKHTQIIFVVQTLILGAEYSIFFLTLWIYISTQVRTSNAKLLYSFTSIAYLATAILVSPLLGKIVDKTRNVKTALFIGNTAIIIGNIIYTIHFSQYCLVIGRIIAGFGGPIKSIIFSEIARSYESENLASQFSLVGTAFYCGFLVGPTINFIFMKTDFYIGNLHITVGNVAGLYLTFIYLVQQLFVYFFVHNLSKEFDLKAKYETMDNLTNNSFTNNDTTSFELKEINTINADDERSETTIAEDEEETLFNSNKHHKNKQALLSMLTNIDILAVLTFTFFQMYLITSVDLILPILIIDVIKWSILELNIVVGSYSVVSISVMLYICWKSASQQSLYYIFLVSLLAMAMLMVSFLLIIMYKDNIALVIILMVINGIVFCILCLSEDLALVTIFTKMIPSELQTFGDSIRLVFERAGSIVALLTSVYMIDFMIYYVNVFSVIIPIGLMISIYRRKHLMKE